MSPAACDGHLGPHARAGYAAPLLAPAWARTIGFAPLLAFCALQWARILDPAPVGEMLAAAALALAGGLVLLAVRARAAVRVLVAAALLVGAVLVAGVAPRLLAPGGWGELLTGLGQGFGDLPATNIPYRGTDPWIATALVLIGALAAALAAWLAFAPRRSGGRRGPGPASVVLAVLFAVPAVQLSGGSPWLEGVVFAVLLCVFLRLERVERHGARAAAVVVVVVGVAAAVAAPRLDVDGPLLDYEALARSLTPDRGLEFSWNHSYGRLAWSRTGREVLRIRARTASYWKVENLSRFDGLRWVQPRELGPTPPEASLRGQRSEWKSVIHVRVRGLLTRLFVGAGTTLRIDRSPRTPIRNAPGTFRTGPRPLREGHAYDATVWTPRPSHRSLRSARGDTPGWAWQYLRMDLPAAVGGPVLRSVQRSALRTSQPAQIAFPAYGDGASPTLEPRLRVDAARSATDVLERSPYGDVYRLARRLRQKTTTPYGFVERVLEHLGDGFGYTETPPGSEVPLVSFLTTDRDGYCQQFSGAMALLLRMGGVPARVATGFSPGTLDRDAGEYVVRDTDAHSWVEAWIAPFGWVTFDPTPPDGPARLTAVTGEAASPYQLGVAAGVLGAADRVTDRRDAAGATGGGAPMALLLAGGSVAGLLVAAGALLMLRRRRACAAPPVDAALAELRAALVATGRGEAPGLTLAAMLRRYGGTPAEAYVRTLQDARYAGGDTVPTPAMRTAMRRELTLGLGPSARLGAWRALPPVIGRRTRRSAAYPDG